MPGAGCHARAFSFFYFSRSVRAVPRPGRVAGSGVQDAGLLLDGVVQVGGGDGERGVQAVQVLPVPGEPGAGVLGGRVAGQGAGHGGGAAEQVSDLLGVQRVKRDAPGACPVAWYRHPAPPVLLQARSANRPGQRATISPQASRQPSVTCPSLSRRTASRCAVGLPACFARCPALFSSASRIASRSVLATESSFGNWVRVFSTLRISRLNDSIAFVL